MHPIILAKINPGAACLSRSILLTPVAIFCKEAGRKEAGRRFSQQENKIRAAFSLTFSPQNVILDSVSEKVPQSRCLFYYVFFTFWNFSLTFGCQNVIICFVSEETPQLGCLFLCLFRYIEGLCQSSLARLVVRLRYQHKQDDCYTGDDVRQPDIWRFIDKAEQEWREGQEGRGHKVKHQVRPHGNKLHARNAQFIIGQQAVDDKANAQHHWNNHGGPTHTVEAKDERRSNKSDAADIVKVGMHSSWNKANSFHCE